jgi:hypothetical protein
MKQTINKSDFHDAFHHANRKEQFSYEARCALFDWLEEIEPEYDLDVIALCCDFSEQPIKDVLEMHDLKDLEELQHATCVVWSDGENVLYQNF